ncbi:MAG: hypothetical protein MUD02_11950 [Bacteroidales bacterium]|nr:hypothetical protein [Bacteroidales bacterium]
MKTKTIILFLLALLVFNAPYSYSQLPKESESQKAQRMLWWTNARFGMFIHWGMGEEL